MLMIMSTLSVYSKPRPNVINVDGTFHNQRNVNFVLYELLKDGSYKELEYGYGRRSFHFQCLTEKTYLVKFIDKKQNTKYLELRVEDSKDLLLDVDFSTNKSISLTYTKEGLTIREISFSSIAMK